MNDSSESEHSEFYKVQSFKVKHVDVSEYVSLLTGVRVFFMSYETPLVNTYIVLPTREETDEGLPHTLEHLIFLGSEKYPFRGTLDLISCKSLSSGCNAWTSVDHTAYTLSTAGLEGTLQMLPMYLDHILRPCLTDVAFMTDVHHVSSDGSSTGVVYCEMKARENLPEEMMYFEASDKLYPGDSGYKRNTGGKLSSLRNTSNQRVRDYHKSYYKWNNVSIVVCGNVTDTKSVLSVIHEQELFIDTSNPYYDNNKENENTDSNVDNKTNNSNKDNEDKNNDKEKEVVRNNKRLKTENKKFDLSSFLKNRFMVWDDPKHVAKLEHSSVSTLYFPCEEEECGTFSMSWRGPVWDDFELVRSVSIMGSYLVDSTASPLEKGLIHTEDPFGSCVDFSIELFKEVYFQLVVKDVPLVDDNNKEKDNNEEKEEKENNKDKNNKEKETKEKENNKDKNNKEKETKEKETNKEKDKKNKMERVGEKLMNVLNDVYNNELDMERMRMLIRRGHFNYLRQIETCAHETLIDNVIGYVIYGRDPKQLEKLVLDNEIVESLLAKDQKFWKDLLFRYFIEPPSVSVKCYPSVEKSKVIEEEEKKLMEFQMKKYGQEQLNRNKEIVDEEMKKNDGGPPKEILERFKQSDTKLIKLPTYPLYRNFKYKLGENKNKEDRETHDKKEDKEERNKIKNKEKEKEDKKRRKEDLMKYINKIDGLRYAMQVNNLPSDFVRIYVLFSTCKLGLSDEEKKLLFLLCVLLFESNVYFGDKLMSSEEFIKTLMENTTSYGCNLGLSSTAVLPDSYSDLMSVYFTCPVDKYKRLLEIFYNVVYKVKYDHDILTKHVKSLLNSFSKKKRSAKTMLKQVNNYLKVNNHCVRYLCSLGQQDVLLKSIVSEEGGASRVEEELSKLHSKVFNVENMTVHMTADLSKLEEDWLDFWVKLDNNKEKDNTDREKELKEEKNKEKKEKNEESKTNRENKNEEKEVDEEKVLNKYCGLEYGRDRKFKDETGVLSSLASTDVSYFCLTVPAPYGFNHSEYFGILVCCEYMTMTEGPMYRAVRGGGYAYHHRVVYLASQGEIQLVITEASDLIQALKVTKECIVKCLDSSSDVEHDMLAAKSSLIYRILSNEESLADYSQETFTNALRETDVDFNKYSVVQIQELKLEDIRKIFEKYFRGFLEFEGPPKTLSCISSKNDAKNISKGLKLVKYNNVKYLDSKSLFGLLSNSAVAQEN